MTSSVAAPNYFRYTAPVTCPNNFNYDVINMYNSYPSSGPSFGGSIFGNNIGMMPGGSLDNSTYFDNMRQYQQFYNDYYIDQQQMYRNQQFQVNAPMNSIQQAARNLKDKINQNEQDQIMRAFDAYVATVARAYGESNNPEDIKNQALALYAQMNGGVTLEEDLRAAGHGSFTQGLISGITLGLYGNNSAEDNISQITGQPVGTDENIKKKVGTFLGGICILGLATSLLRLFIKK